MGQNGVAEAELVETEAGLKPKGPGWFVVNVGDSVAAGPDECHYAFMFEGEPLQVGATDFAHFGINIRVLAPAVPASMYHRESGQEAFLVLSGECSLIIEGQVRSLKQWDFVHCPPHTAHVLVGAGTTPCAVLMVGARNAGGDLTFPVNAAAAKYGASVSSPTSDRAEAYAGWARPHPQRFPWPPR
jgi:uncharacterized cupin superfamily protein